MPRRVITGVLIALLATQTVFAEKQSIIVQSTTSTANSGLYDHLLPLFQEKSKIRVKVVAVGTGQALRNARNCDADVLLVHAKAAEEVFVSEGFGLQRNNLMYNDFVIVGPDEDTAGIHGLTDAQQALAIIADSRSLFASRGDDSGTHKKEMSLWAEAAIDPTLASGTWYRETGSGMGATLNTGIGMGAYVLTDRASWISFSNKQDYTIVVQGDEDLFNQYGVIPLSPEKCPDVRVDAAMSFTKWLLSGEGQAAIAEYRVDGQQLFFPNSLVGPAGQDGNVQ
ncbi:MAG: substrate-binding domain-containing protein [Granulosicoccus sp.]